MRAHRPETQTLYAQLFEATATYEVDLLAEFAMTKPEMTKNISTPTQPNHV